MAVSLSAVNRRHQARRQHPPDHQRQGQEVIPDPVTSTPILAGTKKVTGAAPPAWLWPGVESMTFRKAGPGAFSNPFKEPEYAPSLPRCQDWDDTKGAIPCRDNGSTISNQNNSRIWTDSRPFGHRRGPVNLNDVTTPKCCAIRLATFQNLLSSVIAEEGLPLRQQPLEGAKRSCNNQGATGRNSNTPGSSYNQCES